MTKRICETCRYFRAAGFDNMGWCEHPKRRLSSEVRILARAQEIQCRNEWNSDLWQSADGPGQELPLDSAVRPVGSAPQALPTAQSNQTKPTSPSSTIGVDLVVGEVTTMYTGESVRSIHQREVLRRAHEELKSRKKENRSSVQPLSGLGESVQTESGILSSESQTAQSTFGGNRRSIDDGFVSKSRLIAGEVSPVELGEMGRPFPKMTTFPDEEDRFSSIPQQVDGFDLPLINKPTAQRIVGRAGFEDDGRELTAWDSPPAPVLPDEVDTPLSAPVNGNRAPVSKTNGSASQVQRERSGAHSSSIGEAEVSGYLDLADHNDAVPVPAPKRLPREPRVQIDTTGQAVEYASPVTNRSEARTPVGSMRYREPIAEPEQAFPVAVAVDDYVVDELVEAEKFELEEMPSSTPRMCRTCRDFRPAENGDRGWCTNKWAFSHRRMVDADELPCETSIGGWWLPHDDIWLSTVDVSAHSQPTPLLDHWLAQRAAANGTLDTTPPMRRRQRS